MYFFFSPLVHQLQQQEESIEDVIKDTESLFKSREKEYQDTIDQIEVSDVVTVWRLTTHTGSANRFPWGVAVDKVQVVIIELVTLTVIIELQDPEVFYWTQKHVRFMLCFTTFHHLNFVSEKSSLCSADDESKNHNTNEPRLLFPWRRGGQRC